MKKYNVKEIMLTAHNFRKAENVTMGEALKAAWSVARIKIGASPLDETAQELFLVRAQKAELEAREKALEAKLKAKCAESPDGKISGYGWKASYQEIKGHRFDSKALKAADAETFNRYYVETSTMRFNFGAVSV